MNILVIMPKGQVRDTFFNQENIELLNELGNITWNNTELNYTQDEYKTRIKNQDIVIIGWGSPVLDEVVLENANKLKLVVHTAGSVSPFLCNAVYERGIKVICGNEVMAQSVAEGVIAYILSYNREIPRYSTELKTKGIWKEKTFNTLSLIGKTIGIVSDGSISRYLMEMLQGFRVNILLYTRTLKQEIPYSNVTLVSLEELFSSSDIISLQTALNEHTIGMFDNKYLNLIKKDALLINTARAKIVNENDLISCLKNNQFNAILDVHYNEPILKDNIYSKLDNVFMMPHMAGPTNEARLLIAKTLINEINNVLNNKESIHEIDQNKFNSMSKAM